MSEPESAIHIGLLIVALAATAAVFGRARHEPHLPSATRESGSHASLLSIIPPGSAFVLSADVRQLQRAPLGSFLTQRLSRVAKSSQLETLCGFEPLARLDQLALSVPSAGRAEPEHAEDFGIIASGQFSAAEIMRCAERAISARGGEPVPAELGRFASIRDRNGKGGEVAARDGGLVIVSGGSYFRALLDAAEGNAPRPAAKDERDAQHGELRRALGPGSIVATWLLGEGWFERVAGNAENPQLSALAGVRAVAIRGDVARTLHATVLLDCTNSEAAQQVSNVLAELRRSLRAFPLDPALSRAAERIVVSLSEARLKLTLELDQAELTTLLDLLGGP